MKKKLLKLDLGCGQVCHVEKNAKGKEEKFTGVDFVQLDGVDVVHDLTKFPYPFEDESVEEIYSSHFIEHLDGFDRSKFMEECYRMLIKGGKMKLIFPYHTSVRATQDFTHKFPPISTNSFLYFNKKWREDNKLTHGYYDLKSNFDMTSAFTSIQDNTFLSKSEEARAFAQDKYWNVVADLMVELVKI